MRKLLGALAICCLFLTSLQAFADVTLIKASSVSNINSDELNQHRYENDAKKLDNDSDHITGQLMNRGKDANTVAANSYGGMKVTLIKTRHFKGSVASR